jgi:hypothetical protein
MLDRQTLIVTARARAQHAADAAQLAEFAREIAAIREEAAADRRELAEVRNELRITMTAEELRALDEPFIADIVDSLQRAVNVASPLAVAIGLVRTARALGASSPENRTSLALEMLRVVLEIDPDVVSARWQ